MAKKVKNINKNKMEINYNELALNQRKFTSSEIGRGVGVHRVEKGKGSYTRKQKHKKSKKEKFDYFLEL